MSYTMKLYDGADHACAELSLHAWGGVVGGHDWKEVCVCVRVEQMSMVVRSSSYRRIKVYMYYEAGYPGCISCFPTIISPFHHLPHIKPVDVVDIKRKREVN